MQQSYNANTYTHVHSSSTHRKHVHPHQPCTNSVQNSRFPCAAILHSVRCSNRHTNPVPTLSRLSPTLHKLCAGSPFPSAAQRTASQVASLTAGGPRPPNPQPPPFTLPGETTSPNRHPLRQQPLSRVLQALSSAMARALTVRTVA